MIVLSGCGTSGRLAFMISVRTDAILVKFILHFSPLCSGDYVTSYTVSKKVPKLLSRLH